MSGEPPERSQEEGTAASSPNQPASNALVIPASYVAPTGQGVSTQPVLYFPVPVSSFRGFQVAFMPDQSTTIVTEALAEGSKKRGDPTKSVRVLKQCDVIVSDGTVFLPNKMKNADLQKSEKGQFKTKVRIADPNMTEMDIERLLVEIFPVLENTRFYCAKATEGRLDFVGEPRIWDGRTIRKNLNGNSALYIFAEENFTVAGQSSDHSCGQMLETNNQFQVSSQPLITSVNPKSTSSVGGESLVATQPAQNAFRTSSLRSPQNFTVAGQSSDHSCGQMLETNNQSQVSSQPLITSVIPKSSRPLLGSLKSSTAKTTATIVNASSLPSVSTGSSMRRESLVVNRPDENAYFTSLRSNPQDPAATTKRHHEQMTASDKEVPNQTFKKLRASKEVSNDSKKNVASHDDPNARTPFGSFGTAAARDKVSEQANCSRQKEQLHKLSCRNAEMTEFVQTQPAIQEASQNTEAIPPHSLSLIVSSDVPVGATPQPLDAVRELFQTLNSKELKELANDCPEPDLDLLNSCWRDGDLSATRSPPMLTRSSSCSSFDGYLSASSIGVNAHQLQEEYQNQRDDTFRKPAPSQEMRALVSRDRSKSDSTSSGIGLDDSGSGLLSRDTSDSESSSNMDQIIPKAGRVSMFPPEVDLSGGDFCRFDFTPKPLPEVLSAYAQVGNLGNITLVKVGKFLVGDWIPPSDEPGCQTVTIWSQCGEKLGETELYYKRKSDPEFEESLETVARKVSEDPAKLGAVLSRLAICSGGLATTRSGETQNYGHLGSTLTAQVLLSLLYKAAECGAQVFIKMIFNSSAGRVIFHEYKDSVPLPEVIARNHGHENTALYLEEITARFSKDHAPVDPKRIDWLVFLEAINSPQDESNDASEDESPQPDVRNDSDSSYLGDVESLSRDSVEPSSDSEDDLSEMFSKVSVKEDEIQMEGNKAEKDEREFVYQPLTHLPWAQLDEKGNQKETHDWSNTVLKEGISKGRTLQLRYRPVAALSGCLISLKEINSKGKHDKNQQILKDNDAFQINEHDLRHWIYLLRILPEDIPRHLTTMHERWITQIQFNQRPAEKTQRWLSAILQRMLLDPTEGGTTRSIQSAVAMRSNGDQDMESLYPDDDISIQNEDATLRRRLFNQPVNFCHSTVFEIWMLACFYGPSRKTLFVCVADREDVFPSESWFKDEDCELLMENWNWQLCRLNLVTDKVKRIQEKPANVSIKKKKQGLSLGCPKDVAPTVVKKLEVQDDRTPCDSDVEMYSTDAYRDERKKENDPRMENNDSANERESTDDHKIDRRGDDQSSTTQASRGFLHMAAISGLYETIKMLLESGEDVDQRDQFSLTPLHLACWYGQEPVVKMLLECGANVNAEDRFQRTPLQKAERQNHHSIVQLLLKNDARPSFHQPVSSSMASSNEYTDEQLNYFRICYVTTDILVEGLRVIFKQEWDKLYKLTTGEWKDEPRNGMDFYNKESPRNQRRYAHHLATMKNGNRGEWDCRMLFYAILFSDCVEPGLSAKVKKNVDDLRKFRNEGFAHMTQGFLSKTDFQNAISKVDVAFHALGLSTVKIQDLQYQKTFPTQELTKVLKEVDDLKQEVQEKECRRKVLKDQLQNKAPSFCVLPRKPSHDIRNRDLDMDEVYQRVMELIPTQDTTSVPSKRSFISVNQGGEDHGLPTPSSNKTQSPGSCILFENFTHDQQYLESEEMQNPVPDKLTFRSKASKISNDTQPPGCCNVHQQFMESEEMRNPMPDKWTLRSKGSSFEEDETQLKTDAFKKYSDEKADLSSPDLSDVKFPKEGKTVNTLFRFNKGINAMENLNKDRSLQLALHSLATVCSGFLMSLNDVNGKGRRYKNTGICKENFFLQMLPDLQNGKSVYRHGVSVLLKLSSEDIPRHLSTMHERWITRMHLNKKLTEETTQLLSVVMRKIEFNPAEGGSTSVTQPAVTMKSNFLQASKIWMLNCLYRPTRKTLFVYVGDSQDFFPLQWFEDEDCELSTNCWKWCEYRDRLGERVIEVQEQSVIEFQSTRKKEQGFAPGCAKDAALTGAKTLRVEEDQALSDSVDERSSTDIHCGERKEENHDIGMIFGNDTSESADDRDDRGNYWKEDDHSTISKKSNSFAATSADAFQSREQSCGIGNNPRYSLIQQAVRGDQSNSFIDGHGRNNRNPAYPLIVTAVQGDKRKSATRPQTQGERFSGGESDTLSLPLMQAVVSDRSAPVIVPNSRSGSKNSSNPAYPPLIQAVHCDKRKLTTSPLTLGQLLSAVESDPLYPHLVQVVVSEQSSPVIVQKKSTSGAQLQEQSFSGSGVSNPSYPPVTLAIGGNKSGPVTNNLTTSGDSRDTNPFSPPILHADKDNPTTLATGDVLGENLSTENKGNVSCPLVIPAFQESFPALALIVDEYAKADEYFRIAIAIAKEVDGKHGGAMAFDNNLYHLNKALAINKEIGDKHVEAVSYGNLGAVFQSRSEYAKAEEYYLQSLALRRQIGKKKGEVAYHTIKVKKSAKKYTKLKEFLHKAITIYMEIGDKEKQATSYEKLRAKYQAFFSFPKTIEYHRIALDIRREMGDKQGEATSYGNLAAVLYSCGEHSKTEECLHKALAIYRKLGDKQGEAACYRNLSLCFQSAGEYAKAEEYFSKALVINEEGCDKRGDSAVRGLFHFANKYATENFIGTELEINKEIVDNQVQAACYENLGAMFLSVHKYAKAEEYLRKAISISMEIGDKHGDATGYGNLGAKFQSDGEYAKARQCHSKALAIMRQIGDKHGQAACYENLGAVLLSVGAFAEAEEYLNKAFEIREEVRGKNEEATSHVIQEDLFQSLGAYSKTEEYLFKKVIANEPGAAAYLHLYRQTLHHTFAKAEGCLHKEVGNNKETGVKEGEPASFESPNVGGSAKDKEYLHSLHEINQETAEDQGAHTWFLRQYQTNVPDVLSSVFERIQNCRKMLDFQRTNCQCKITSLPSQVYPNHLLGSLCCASGKPCEALQVVELGRAKAFVEQMLDRYSVKEETALNPSLFVGMQNAIRKNSSSTFIYISCFGEDIFLWVIKQSKPVVLLKTSFCKGYGSTHNYSSVAAVFVDESLRNVSGLPQSQCEDRSLFSLKAIQQTSKSSQKPNFPSFGQEESRHSEIPTLRQCYELLIAPVRNFLEGPELIVVPDPRFYQVPFAALPDARSKCLSDTFRIRIIPSLTTLQLSQESPAVYHTSPLIIGEPNVGRVFYKGRVKKLCPLPGARKEAEMIARLLPGSRLLVGEEATKQAVLQSLESASLIHVAAHSDAAKGEIALSPPNLIKGIPYEQDYLLSVAEISEVRLRAKLVVLSCCQSTCGQIKIDAIVGFARALLGLGARSVLVPLWPCDNKSTEQFMSRFYENLFQGESCSESHHQAMKWMQNNGFSDMRQWAPFAIIGDNVSFDFEK